MKQTVYIASPESQQIHVWNLNHEGALTLTQVVDVPGQVQPGIPVWKTGPESKFPGLSYIIFPGNVGDKDTLKKIVELLA